MVVNEILTIPYEVAISFSVVDTYLDPLTQTMKAKVRKGERYENIL